VAGSMRLVRGKDAWALCAYPGRYEAGPVRDHCATFQGSEREGEGPLARPMADTERHPTTVQVEASLPTPGERTTVNDAIATWRDNGWVDLSPTAPRPYEVRTSNDQESPSSCD